MDQLGNSLELQNLIDKRIKELVPVLLRSTTFTSRKLTDTPSDDNQVVPRGYLTNNGSVTNRPKSSVATIGQPYMATDTGIPMTYTSAGWVNGVGSVVALNN